MKKLILATVILLTVSATTAMAKGTKKVDPKVLSSFKKEFVNATNVHWLTADDVSRASFVLNESRIQAYFSNEGELLGTERNILFAQLPLSVVKEVNSRYGLTPVYGITEYNNGSGTFYYMTVELASKKLTVRATPYGDVYVEKKTRK